MKILVVSSVGGHLTEVNFVSRAFGDNEVVLVVNDRCSWPNMPFSRAYQIVHAERDWRVAKNFAEAARILEEERPDIVFSMGAGPAIPFMWLARLVGVRTVYLETFASVERPSLSARMLHGIVDELFFQWPALAHALPKGKLLPVLALGQGAEDSTPDLASSGVRRIFVTVGTATQGFDRMLKMVESATENSEIQFEGVAQVGVSKHRVSRLHNVEFMSRYDFTQELLRADVVVTHGGVGTLLQCFAQGLRPIVVPRLEEQREIANDHQLEIVRELKGKRAILGVENVNELVQALQSPPARRPRDLGMLGISELANALRPNARAARWHRLKPFLPWAPTLDVMRVAR